MKIGVFTYDFYPFEGGQGRHVYEIYKRLIDKSEIDLTVFSPNDNDLKNHFKIFPFTKIVGKHLLFSFLLHFKIRKLIKKYGLEVIHLHGGPGGIFFLKKLDIPIIYTSHHTYYQQIHFIPKQKWKWIFNIIESASYKKASKIIAVSSNTKKILIKHYAIQEKNISVIPNGVDISHFYPMKVENIENSILYVGRLDKRKGIDFLIKTIPLIKEEIPDIKLFIGGKGKLRESLEEFVKLNNLNDNVEFLGFISEDELTKWYNRAELVVIPSIFEGFGITAIEAMACGTPVIGTKVDGLVDVINNEIDGFLVEYDNKILLSKKIITLMKNKKLKQNFVNKGLQKVGKLFNWNKISELTLENYQDL